MSERRYRLEFDPRREYLRVQCRGVLDARTDRFIDEDVRRKCAELDLQNLLIDIRPMQGRLTMLENFEAGATFGKRLGRSVRRIAIVDRGDSEIDKGNRFFELVAGNRNACVKFFGSVEDAESWLTSAAGPASAEEPAPC